jgi:hypothetical protein
MFTCLFLYPSACNLIIISVDEEHYKRGCLPSRRSLPGLKRNLSFFGWMLDVRWSAFLTLTLDRSRSRYHRWWFSRIWQDDSLFCMPLALCFRWLLLFRGKRSCWTVRDRYRRKGRSDRKSHLFICQVMLLGTFSWGRGWQGWAGVL